MYIAGSQTGDLLVCCTSASYLFYDRAAIIFKNITLSTSTAASMRMGVSSGGYKHGSEHNGEYRHESEQ